MGKQTHLAATLVGHSLLCDGLNGRVRAGEVCGLKELSRWWVRSSPRCRDRCQCGCRAAGTAGAEPVCPRLYVVAIPGTWETGPTGATCRGPGMLAGATEGLPSDIQVHYVRYAATAFPWEGAIYGKSAAEAINRARAYIARCRRALCPRPSSASSATARARTPRAISPPRSAPALASVPPSRVAAVGLLSDPSRSPTDIQIGPHAGGAGARGPSPRRLRLADRGHPHHLRSAATSTAPPPVTTMPARFAGFLTQMSDLNPARIWSYQEEFGSILGDLMNGGGVRMLQSQFTDTANERRASRTSALLRLRRAQRLRLVRRRSRCHGRQLAARLPGPPGGLAVFRQVANTAHHVVAGSAG